MSVAYHDFMPPEDIAEEEDGPLGTSGGGGGGKEIGRAHV